MEPVNGQPSWSIGIGELRNPVATLDEIFSYLQNADKPCILAIDEFQQITKYPETTVEATIRTYVQKTTNAHFIFSGSQRHLMTGMFTSPSRPFYQSVTIINLQPIPLDKYTGFTVEKFEQGGKKVAKDVVSVLYERFDGVTSYIHRVLNILYSRTEAGCMCESGDIDNAVDFLVRMSSDSYESLLYQMPLKQRDLLLAIASEGKVSQIMGGKFIKKHSLLSSSSVSSALKGLLDKDFVTEDKGTYSLYDKFFVLWLEKRGLIDRD